MYFPVYISVTDIVTDYMYTKIFCIFIFLKKYVYMCKALEILLYTQNNFKSSRREFIDQVRHHRESHKRALGLGSLQSKEKGPPLSLFIK